MKKTLNVYRILILCLTIIFCQPNVSKSQNVLQDSVVKQKLFNIQQTLKSDHKRSKIWWNAWLYGYSGATVAQGILATSKDLSSRQDMILGASTTFLGAIGQLITPIEKDKSLDEIYLLPENTQEQRLYKLHETEKILEQTAQREKFGRSWQTQALYGVVNIGSGLITWLSFKRNVWAGVENFALNTAASEIQIYTQPMRTAKLYDNYFSKNNTNQTFLEQPKIFWSTSFYPGGIKLSLTF